MKNSWFTASCLLISGPLGAHADMVHVVSVKDNDICLGTVEDASYVPDKCLTSDRAAKSLPVWSTDGTQLAFVKQTSESKALASVVILQTDGRVIGELAVHPVKKDEVAGGMRFVEALEWLSPTELAVSGSIDPSITEYLIFNIPNRSVERQFTDDGGGAAFSRDGKHAAYMTGSPHFSAASDRAPTLNVDGQAVYELGHELTTVGSPIWGSNNFSLALLAHNATRDSYVVLVRNHASPNFTVLPLPFPAKDQPLIYWDSEGLYAIPRSSLRLRRSEIAETWHLPDTTRAWARGTGINATVQQAKEWTEAKRRLVIETGLREPDFWCTECASKILPRRSTNNW